MTLIRIFLFLTFSALLRGASYSQSLPDTILQQLRSGTLGILIPEDSVVLPLVGTPTLPLVEVRINGTGPFRFLLDLGSNVTLLRRNVVDSSKCLVLVERSTSDIVCVRSVELGDARLENVTAASYDELDVDGVLGYNVLQYSSFTLDFPRQKLIFHRQSLPVPNGVSVLNYKVENRMPYIRVAVGSDSLSLNLDTGASEVMTIPVQMQSRLNWVTPPKPGRTVTNNQTGRVQILEGLLADPVRFGRFQIVSPLVYVNPDAEEAWLGAKAMNQAIWVFDPQQRRIGVTIPMNDR